MGLIKRINSAVLIDDIEKKFANNPLKKNKKFELDFSVSDELAVNNPVKFIYKYVNFETIQNALNQNLQIKLILNENNLSKKIELENVTSIITSHLIPTARIARKIYSNAQVIHDSKEYLNLIQAALIHDIGKVFIPKSILNKNGKLTPLEREIVELHNKFSYEIIKTTDLDNKVAILAKEHHDYEKNLKRNPLNQSLTVADIYCALREKRPYKKAINDLGAKAILYDMAANGSFDINYIKYLW